MRVPLGKVQRTPLISGGSRLLFETTPRGLHFRLKMTRPKPSFGARAHAVRARGKESARGLLGLWVLGWPIWYQPWNSSFAVSFPPESWGYGCVRKGLERIFTHIFHEDVRGFGMIFALAFFCWSHKGPTSSFCTSLGRRGQTKPQPRKDVGPNDSIFFGLSLKMSTNHAKLWTHNLVSNNQSAQ